MTDIRIVHNKLLRGWFIVRGPHQTPLGGRFDTKAEAQAHLDKRKPGLRATINGIALVMTENGWRKA
jgi:hypothetical protein